ncbi:hypothetical protein, partial [Streptomyces sp. NPDC060205]|uniref:hypothetical protein n=1 Tax=Streptomyces sp. NPDC060205 TaxID=3347072 RepID=UPI003652BC04
PRDSSTSPGAVALPRTARPHAALRRSLMAIAHSLCAPRLPEGTNEPVRVIVARGLTEVRG